MVKGSRKKRKSLRGGNKVTAEFDAKDPKVVKVCFPVTMKDDAITKEYYRGVQEGPDLLNKITKLQEMRRRKVGAEAAKKAKEEAAAAAAAEASKKTDEIRSAEEAKTTQSTVHSDTTSLNFGGGVYKRKRSTKRNPRKPRKSRQVKRTKRSRKSFKKPKKNNKKTKRR